MGRFDIATGKEPSTAPRARQFISMKELVEAYDHNFIKDGKRIFNTIVDVPFSELPENCDFSFDPHNGKQVLSRQVEVDSTTNTIRLDISVMNVLYDDCLIWIRGFDTHRNCLQIKLPKTIQYFLYQAYNQGLRECIGQLEKMQFENCCTKFKQPIGYSNTVTATTARDDEEEGDEPAASLEETSEEYRAQVADAERALISSPGFTARYAGPEDKDAGSVDGDPERE